ncbi:MAG: hypothetical protein WCO30_01515 [bacterium]
MKTNGEAQKVLVILVLPRVMYLPGATLNQLSQLCTKKACEVVRKMNSTRIYEPVIREVSLCGSVLPISYHINKIVEEIFKNPDDYIDSRILKRIRVQVISPTSLKQSILQCLRKSFANYSGKKPLVCGGTAELDDDYYEIAIKTSTWNNLKEMVTSIWNGDY